MFKYTSATRFKWFPAIMLCNPSAAVSLYSPTTVNPVVCNEKTSNTASFATQVIGPCVMVTLTKAILYLSPNLPEAHHQSSWDFYSGWSCIEWWSGDKLQATCDRWQMTENRFLSSSFFLDFLVSVLLSASVERCFVSRMRDFFYYIYRQIKK